MSMSPEEKAEFLQIYLDETEEELDALVETLLVLEEQPESREHLNEAFRMVHSMKGAAGMMGFQDITALTHQLESRFEKLRSGTVKLDQPTMAVSLKCVDFLRQCNAQLRAGEPFSSVVDLLNELHALEQATAEPPSVTEEYSDESVQPTLSTPDAVVMLVGKNYHLILTFEPGMKLLDMKGQLVVTRVQEVAEVIETRPELDQLAALTGPVKFELLVVTDRSSDDVLDAADVFGVTNVDIQELAEKILPEMESVMDPVVDEQPKLQASERDAVSNAESVEVDALESVDLSVTVATDMPRSQTAAPVKSETPAPVPAEAKATESKAKVAETVRVEIDRLDNLLNLAGELVVNKARFAQIATQMTPVFKQSNGLSRVRSFGENLRGMLDGLRESSERNGDSLGLLQIGELEDELDDLVAQWERWDESRRCFGQINEAIDQLSRVSDSLQRGVLQTRMVPVAPLFNRFKRVVRDISMERDKKINLQIQGEKTELDKRMIDELGDPLVHLVRNSIDHGMESPEDRVRAGKPEVGTITLEASHSGNNVYIYVRDDGGGINVDRIREKIVQRELVSASVADQLTDEQVIDFIWNPGFSTAAQVTNISGRGVGMDIVKTRIAELNGTIDVATTPGEGTTFTIRLPLTLAIINSLLFRIAEVVYSVPIDDVREIVLISRDEVVAVHGKHTFHLRGQYLPLVSIEDLFTWHDVDYGYKRLESTDDGDVNILVLQTADRAIGLRVDALIGGEDIVIKSLSENFVNIRGLSGASILGDGTVSLLLDVGTVLDLSGSVKATVA